MSDFVYKEIPESFVAPDENNLPPVLPTRMSADADTDIYTEHEPTTELDEIAEEITKHNPGSLMGILSIILSILPLMFILGLPFSIVSVSKSRKAKKPSYIGIVGFIFNLIALIATAFLVIVMFGLVDGLNQVCTTLTNGGTLVLPNGYTYTCPM